jgi:hypothetical protein
MSLFSAFPFDSYRYQASRNGAEQFAGCLSRTAASGALFFQNHYRSEVSPARGPSMDDRIPRTYFSAVSAGDACLLINPENYIRVFHEFYLFAQCSLQ